MSKLELGKMISVSLTASHLEVCANLIDVVATGYFVKMSHPATTFLPLLFSSVDLSERHTAAAYSFTSKMTAYDVVLYFSAVFHQEYFETFYRLYWKIFCASLVYSALPLQRAYITVFWKSSESFSFSFSGEIIGSTLSIAI